MNSPQKRKKKKTNRKSRIALLAALAVENWSNVKKSGWHSGNSEKKESRINITASRSLIAVSLCINTIQTIQKERNTPPLLILFDSIKVFSIQLCNNLYSICAYWQKKSLYKFSVTFGRVSLFCRFSKNESHSIFH